jgi:hypothetical protein
MKFSKIVLGSIIVWIVSTIYLWLTCGWLFKWVYEIEPTVAWKGAMGGNTVFASLLLGLIVAFLFSYVFSVLYKGIPGKGINKGLAYGFLVWLVGGLSGVITMPLYMNIAVSVVIYWAISFLALKLINGAILGKVFKK